VYSPGNLPELKVKHQFLITNHQYRINGMIVDLHLSITMPSCMDSVSGYDRLG